MNALVIYDSKFGNTQRLAKAIGAALEGEFVVQVHSVEERPTIPADLDLLLIGGPTHAHGLSQPMRDFLASIPRHTLRAIQAQAFDTRFRMLPILSGRAAPKIARALRTKGATMLGSSESFFVARTEGHPLEPGEEQRAAEWAKTVMPAAVAG